MSQTQTPPGRLLATPLFLASLLALTACGGDPEPAPVIETSKPQVSSETVRSALGKITLEAASEGQEILGVQVAEDRGVVNLRYAGPAERFVSCDNAGWLAPDGGVVDVNLSKNVAFESIDNRGDPISIERWVRLDALTNVVVQAKNQNLQIEPRSRYIVSMVTEVYDLNTRIGHKAERLEFDSGGSAVTSTGHRCESTGALEQLARTAAS